MVLNQTPIFFNLLHPDYCSLGNRAIFYWHYHAILQPSDLIRCLYLRSLAIDEEEILDIIKSLAIYLPPIFGISLFVLLFFFIGSLRINVIFDTLDPLVTLKAASAFFIAVILLEGARTKILFEDYGLKYHVAVQITFIGVFFGNFTPGMVGTEIYKVHFAHRLRAGFAKPLALVVVLRLIGLAVTVFTTILVLILFDIRFDLLSEFVTPFSSDRPAMLAAGLAAGLTVLAILLGSAWRAGRMIRLLNLWQGVIDALKQIRVSQLLGITGLSFLVLGARAAFLIWLVRALAGSLGPAEGLLAAAGSVLASALPVSFGGLGVQEGALAGILFTLGTPESTALAAALLNRILIWLIALAGGLIFLLSRTTRNPSVGRKG